MKKLERRKLVLNGEVVRELGAKQLRGVNGGGEGTVGDYTCKCFYTQDGCGCSNARSGCAANTTGDSLV